MKCLNRRSSCLPEKTSIRTKRCWNTWQRIPGGIRFKEYAFVGDCPVQTELIASMVFIPLQMIDLYSDGILSVLFDFKTPREAFEALSN